MSAPTPQYTCFPALAPSDVQQAAHLIVQAYAPGGTPEQQQRLQAELFEIQKRPEAWGLVVPFLEAHADPNVEFFGAHTAQVKIARDWSAFPEDEREALRDALLDVTARAALANKPKPVLRKLFVALTSLAIRLAPLHPSRWPDWVVSTVQLFSQRGVHSEHILDFLAIAAEEIQSSDLLGITKMRMNQTLLDAVQLTTAAVKATMSNPGASQRELQSAMKCLSAWITFGIPADDLTGMLPMLLGLLNSPTSFAAATEALDAVLTGSSLASGAGTRTLTEPLLDWLATNGPTILAAYESEPELAHALCKLLAALGDHSVAYIAAHLGAPRVQAFLRLVLGFQALPGVFGVDEEESELVLPFWYLLQEALWNADTPEDGPHWAIAQQLYAEVVVVLRRKATWPPPHELRTWQKDQRDRFTVYRRDIGDSLVNAYYVLRDTMARSLVDVVAAEVARPLPHGWEDAEAALHCLTAIQEGVPPERESEPILGRLFSADILGRLPASGTDRVRLTALSCIGSYASWFAKQDGALLLSVINYVVGAIHEPVLCLYAVNALRDLCDSNRAALAPHIAAFGELYSKLDSIPDTERNKILQSIASVIQALPPDEAIGPVEGIISPVVSKLMQALNNSATLPDEARLLCMTELQALTGCAKGLTSQMDLWYDGDDEEGFLQKERERMERARADPRMVALRDAVLQALSKTVEIWSTDAGISDALSETMKSITALPQDLTLLTLSPMPLLQLVAVAARRQLTAVWLGLAGMLIVQLNPPTSSTLKPVPNAEARAFVVSVLPLLLEPALASLAAEEQPDVAQAFFKFLEQVATNFIWVFFELPPGAFDAVMRCAIAALGLQERYSLVAACSFLLRFLQTAFGDDTLGTQVDALLATYGLNIVSALLFGIAGVAPRSVVPNLSELLARLITSKSELCRMWMTEVLFSDGFENCKADADAREKFLKALMSARSPRRTRDAAQQFALVARGLDNSSFGYATVSM